MKRSSLLFACAVPLVVAPAIAGCVKCPDGQERTQTAWQTGPGLSAQLVVQGNDSKEYCFYGFGQGWRSGGGPPPENLKNNKVRVITSCGPPATGSIDMSWFDEGGARQPIEWARDTGIIDAEGALCVRSNSSSEVTIMLELYMPVLGCAPSGVVSVPAVVGGHSPLRCLQDETTVEFGVYALNLWAETGPPCYPTDSDLNHEERLKVFLDSILATANDRPFDVILFNEGLEGATACRAPTATAPEYQMACDGEPSSTGACASKILSQKTQAKWTHAQHGEHVIVTTLPIIKAEKSTVTAAFCSGKARDNHALAVQSQVAGVPIGFASIHLPLSAVDQVVCRAPIFGFQAEALSKKLPAIAIVGGDFNESSWASTAAENLGPWTRLFSKARYACIDHFFWRSDDPGSTMTLVASETLPVGCPESDCACRVSPASDHPAIYGKFRVTNNVPSEGETCPDNAPWCDCMKDCFPGYKCKQFEDAGSCL